MKAGHVETLHSASQMQSARKLSKDFVKMQILGGISYSVTLKNKAEKNINLKEGSYD